MTKSLTERASTATRRVRGMYDALNEIKTTTTQAAIKSDPTPGFVDNIDALMDLYATGIFVGMCTVIAEADGSEGVHDFADTLKEKKAEAFPFLTAALDNLLTGFDIRQNRKPGMFNALSSVTVIAKALIDKIDGASNTLISSEIPSQFQSAVDVVLSTGTMIGFIGSLDEIGKDKEFVRRVCEEVKHIWLKDTEIDRTLFLMQLDSVLGVADNDDTN